MIKILHRMAPLIAIVTLLIATTHFWAGMHASKFSLQNGLAHQAFLFPALFLGFLTACVLIESVWRVKEFVEEETGQVNLHALWHETIFKINPISGILVSFFMGAGIIGCANLAEIYRNTATTWYDSSLWLIEKPLFSILLASRLNVPVIWDKVYFLLWPFVFLAMALVFKRGHQQQFVKIALAVVLAFYLTRIISLLLPTAGPVFYRPELFDLGNTLTAQTQELLRLYMAGHVIQNGLMPGTMAMPSLHVGLAAIAAWVLACEWRWTLWLTTPWLLLIWMSTIMLGWHYALDGVGGIIVIGISMVIARYLLNLWSHFFARNSYVPGS
jgi:hypothetical protein